MKRGMSMLCFNCQNEIAENAKFCKFCGQNQSLKQDAPTEISATDFSEPEVVQNEAQTYQPPQEEAPQEGTYQTYQPPQEEAPQEGTYQTYQPPQEEASQTFEQDQEGAYQGGTPPIEPPVPPEPKTSFFTPRNIAITGGAAAVVALGIIFAPKLFSNPTADVEKAFNETGVAIETEYNELMAKIPAYTFFDGIYTDSYKFSTEYEGASLDVFTNFKDKQIRADASMLGTNVSMLLSDKHLTIETSLLDDVYGINFDTAVDDLSSSEFFGFIELPEGTFDLMSTSMNLDEIYDEFGKMSELFIGKIVNASEIEKVSDLEVEVDGDDMDLDTYELYITANDLEDALLEGIDVYFEDGATVEALERNIELYNSYANVYGQYGMEYGAEMDIDDIKDSLEDTVKEIADGYKEIEDEPIIISLHDGKIARIEIMSPTGSEIVLSLVGGSSILDEIKLSSKGESMTFSMFYEDDYFVFEYDFPDGTGGFLEYDTISSDDNFIVSMDGMEVIFTLDSTEEGVIRFEFDNGYESIEIEAEKDDFIFEQDDYINILQMTEGEIMDVISEIERNLGDYSL